VATLPDAKVHLLPLDTVVSVANEQTLFEAAREQGLNWPTACHGEGWCTLCYVAVVEGNEQLPLPSIAESEALSNLSEAVRSGLHPIRLACQIRPVVGLKVHKRGVGRDKSKSRILSEGKTDV
jgi:ferredoxin, 2Fe-2S